MNVVTNSPNAVPSEEVHRRLAEYQRIGLERQAPAHVVYHSEHVDCPWAGCGFRIAGINFRLEAQGDKSQQGEWLTTWWAGPGLIAKCPGCGQFVLFSHEEKRAVSDPAWCKTAMLPEAWHTKAHVVEGNA